MSSFIITRIDEAKEIFLNKIEEFRKNGTPFVSDSDKGKLAISHNAPGYKIDLPDEPFDVITVCYPIDAKSKIDKPVYCCDEWGDVPVGSSILTTEGGRVFMVTGTSESVKRGEAYELGLDILGQFDHGQISDINDF